MTPSNDDHAAGPPAPTLALLPYGFEASLGRALAEASGTQLALVVSEWMALQVRHARRAMGSVAAAVLDLTDGSYLTPRVTSVEAAGMLREAVVTVRERDGLPADVAEALMEAAPHVLVGDDVAGAIARTALRLSRGDGTEWPEGSMLDAVRRDPDTDAWTVLFVYAATGEESGRWGGNGQPHPSPYPSDPYGFDRLGADEGYALPPERARAPARGGQNGGRGRRAQGPDATRATPGHARLPLRARRARRPATGRRGLTRAWRLDRPARPAPRARPKRGGVAARARQGH